MAIKRLHIIRLFVFLLLQMVGGTTNEAWGKITYHILTLPFTTYNDNGSARFSDIRVEALRCTSNDLTVGLPDFFKSPLVDPESFTYYAATNVTRNGTLESSGGSDDRKQIYQYITTKYDVYAIVDAGETLTEGSAIADNSHVYVTYTYDNATSPIKLDGSVAYNIMLGNRFLCFNKGRNNRTGAILATNVTNENLVSNDFTFVEKPGFDNNKNQWFHFLFKYEGNDPYNITIRTAYNGDLTFRETDKALNKTVTKWYKGSSIFCQGKADGGNMLWLASDDNVQYTQTDAAGEVTYVNKPGFYRGGTNNQSEMNPIFNSFAILNSTDGTGYIYIGSKINTNGNNWQPNGSGQYFYLTGNVSSGRDPKYQMKTPANAEKSTPYPIDIFTYKVTSALGTEISVDVKMSNYEKTENILSYIPENIKRKYVTFTGAYKTSALDGIPDNQMTTFADAIANGKVVWLKYTSSMPFDALTSISSSYDNARWYTIRMNGDQENKYVAFYDTSNSNVMSTGPYRGSESDIHQGENSPEAKVAFIGDPFDLRILCHKASEDITGAGLPALSDNRYIGCATDATDGTPLNGNKTGSSDISSWEIVYENTQMETMILRQRGTAEDENPKYIGWNYLSENKPMTLRIGDIKNASRIKVVELDKKNYVYHIMRADHSIAVKATEAQDVGRRLKYNTIPEIIRSPLIDPSVYTATITFYYTEADAIAGTNPHDHAPYDPATEGYDIYVRYTTETSSLTKNYNVRLNGQYIYYNTSDENINSQTDPEANDKFVWHLNLTDPYAMNIKNMQALKYVKKDGAAWANNQPFTWDAEEKNASLFIVKSSTTEGVYEVMAATGDDVDASTTYYNIGRPEVNTVRMYANSSYPHGYAQLRFLLTPTDASVVEYHLYDKSGTELLKVKSRRPDLYFPADYRSPLVETYFYWTTSACNVTLASLVSATDQDGDDVPDIYVTYDTSNRIDLQKGVMYLLKYEAGDSFHQEDGADGLTTSAVQAVYPYCNGDCNFFVYGQNEFELQQQGAASTRTRWAWYLESDNNDPYHVKICSRQTETFNSTENRGYFRTYVENFGGSKHVITSLAWPGITGVQGTEYMVLGSVGQYQLVTTESVDDDITDERRIVKSFEQYWKTFDTVRKKIFGDPASSISPEDPTIVPATPAYSVTTAAGLDNNRTYLTTAPPTGMGFHNYSQWAYAKRWNGYNKSGAKSKGWEEIEHWYQTVNMGEGYFDFVSINIEPALILLDQHGWEIMRKPLPNDPDDPTKEAKYEAIRPYNSPMVKEYSFWGSAKKRTGFHQYYSLSGQIKVDDKIYTSTDLTKLPDYYNSDGTRNSTLFDKKGNLLDQYVTYVAKDEYLQSYSVEYETATAKDPDKKDYTKITKVNGTGAKFLIQQGDSYVSTSDGTLFTLNDVVDPGGMSQTIINANGSFSDHYLWYVKPNTDIDKEMGYDDYPHEWVNDYDNKTKVKTSGFNSWAFDPYNIQISSAAYTTKFFVTNATDANIDDGAFVGTYSSDPTVSLGPQADVPGHGMDNRTLDMTNATFMAVQDENGNMQLMPRFDNTRRVSSFNELVGDVIGDNVEMPNTHTKLFRPAIYNYKIIDNDGNESLRYQSGGDLTPHIPTHFQSPLAKDFTFYKTLLDENSDGTFELGTLADEITESFAGKDMSAPANDVFVRYAYDADADVDYTLKGKWFSMQLNEMDAKYDGGIKQGTDKPATIDGSQKAWQWKFLETPQTTPDPYAVYIYNRSQTEGTEAIDKRFALLSHTSGGFALAEAGLGTALEYDYTYKFLNGASMTTSVAATTTTESGFKSTSCSFSGTGSQVKLIDDVYHTYIYRVYTNGTNGNNAVKYGVFAISANQIQAEASQNEFVPVIPDAIMTPLLNFDQFLYYEKESYMGDSDKELSNLYGMYEDDVYVRYTAYDELRSGYKVPNDKTTSGGHVARGNNSNDTPLGLSGSLFYNIIWYNDNMMKSNGSTITYTANQNLKSETDYEWRLDGNDPYAIIIKNMSDKKVYESSTDNCSLSDDNATTFMLLNKDGYEYGVLQKTGGSKMLSGYGQKLEASDATHPTKFVIFALATHKVIYHLVIANVGEETEEIPYRENQTMPDTPVAWNSSTDIKQFPGTTRRDLTSGSPAGATYQLGSTMTLGGSSVNYCYDAGQISLGDKLKVPDVFARPNVAYSYVVEGVYSNDACTEVVSGMNDKYKGYVLDKMGDDTHLLGKTVRINITYRFDSELITNVGEGFVTDVAADNQWYTVETEDDDGTPWLAQYTNAWGLEVKSGRDTHYTNDYLWSPLGDPYGFQFYNRYIYKNSGDGNTGEPHQVMTTTGFAENQAFVKGSDTDANSVYELLNNTAVATSEEGYFLMHPVVNKAGTQYYMKTVDEGGGSVSVKLGEIPTPFTFGLNKELFDPYFRYVGYIGALKKTVYDDPENADVVEAMTSEGDIDPALLMKAQQIVYNDENLRQFEAGYYRLHSPSGIEGISPIRYASGYTHAIERDPNGDDDEADAIPMHFYEQEGVETSFDVLPKQAGGVIGYTESPATRGELPIPAVEYDPASIFYITGSNNTNVKMSTQGLYVKGATAPDVAEGTGVRAKAYMTASEAGASALWMMDIGGGVFLIHDRTVPANRKYLSYHQNDGAKIYDLKLTHNTHTDHAKWCLQPVEMKGLYIKTHSGGDEEKYGTSYNYASFYAPFDILLPDDATEKEEDEDFLRVYQAFICDDENSPWSPPSDLHPKAIGRYSKTGSRPTKYNTEEYKNKFVPAGTPVLLAMWDPTDYVKVTLPTSEPSVAMTTGLSYTYGDIVGRSCNNILSGQYLEQKLNDVTSTERIYTFGLPLTGTLHLDPATGDIDATLPLQDNAGLGFYLNANPNKETNGSRNEWTRNNWYVYGNKVYYKATGYSSSARGMTRGVNFVPVVFDWEENKEDKGLFEDTSERYSEYVGDGCVYDMTGRRVATEEQVLDGTWKQRVSPGIYIFNGKKISVN